jgi:hypothetical protein
MEFPVLLYGTETWTLKKRDSKRIRETEMNYQIIVKSRTRADQLRNECKGNALCIFPLYEEITEHRNKWKIYL